MSHHSIFEENDEEIHMVSAKEYFVKLKPDLDNFVIQRRKKLSSDDSGDKIISELESIACPSQRMKVAKLAAIRKLLQERKATKSETKVDSDDDEEESEDDDSEEESEEESEESENEESNEEDEEEKVNIKVCVLPISDIRGFTVSIDKNGLKKIRKAVKEDYGDDYQLFYRDTDGDTITIRSINDLKYAFRTAQQEQKDSSGGANLRLKLFAEKKVLSISKPTKPSKRVQIDDGSTERLTINNNSKSYNSVGSTASNEFGTPIDFTQSMEVRESAIKVSIFDGSGVRSGRSSLSHRDGRESSSSRQSNTYDRDELCLDVNNNYFPSGKSGSGGAGGGNEVFWKRGDSIGAGSFGQVFSGINLANGERIAVKEVQIGRIRSKDHAGGNASAMRKRQREQVKALQREIQILCTLQHPNIIRYLGTEFTHQTFRVFMELASEGTIKDSLNEFGAFPEPLIRRYTCDILEGLAYLHGKRIIHRDIKPSNMLLSAGVVKLADFGCSANCLDEDNPYSSGNRHTMVGTAIYMAPEVMNADNHHSSSGATTGDTDDDPLHPGNNKQQRKGSKNSSGGGAGGGSNKITSEKDDEGKESSPSAAEVAADCSPVIKSEKRSGGYGTKADIWSLGISLCEMAAGGPPFKNPGAAIFTVCVSKQYPKFPAEFSDAAHQFLSRCLLENPRDRATVEELKLLPFIAVQTAASMGTMAHNASMIHFGLTGMQSLPMDSAPPTLHRDVSGGSSWQESCSAAPSTDATTPRQRQGSSAASGQFSYSMFNHTNISRNFHYDPRTIMPTTAGAGGGGAGAVGGPGGELRQSASSGIGFKDISLDFDATMRRDGPPQGRAQRSLHAQPSFGSTVEDGSVNSYNYENELFEKDDMSVTGGEGK